MVDETPAKVWSDQRDLPIHLGDSGDGFRLPFKEKWRLPDAVALLVGFVVTASLVTVNLESGNAAAHRRGRDRADRGRGVGAVETAGHPPIDQDPPAVVAGRPAPDGVVLTSPAATGRPRGAMTLIPDDAPAAAIGNLRFTTGGVYADYLVSGPAVHLPAQRIPGPGGRRARRPAAHPAVRGAAERADRAGGNPQHHPANALCAPGSAPRHRRCGRPDAGPHRTMGATLPAVGPGAAARPVAPAYPLAEPAAGLRPGRRAPPPGDGSAGWTQSSVATTTLTRRWPHYRATGRQYGRRAAAGAVRQTGQRGTGLVALELHRQPPRLAAAAAQPAV